MAFNLIATEFEQSGYRLAALATGAAPRAQKLRRDLDLSFPMLCDTKRETVQAWGLYNARDFGGIAVPATVVIGADGRVQMIAREGVTKRLRPEDVLAFAAAGGEAPVEHGFWPGLRDWWRAFIH